MEEAQAAMGVLSAWPRGLPQAARITLVDVRSISNATVDELQGLLQLLDRAERVQCHTVRGCCADLQELILRLRTVPREVLLQVPMGGYDRLSVTLRLAVGGVACTGRGSSGSGQFLGETREGGQGCGGSAAAGSGVGQEMGDGSGDFGLGSRECSSGSGERDPGRGEQAEAGGGGMQLPTAEGLLTWAVAEMEGRARREAARQGQGLDGGREGSELHSGDAHDEEEDECKEKGSFAHWWRYGRWVPCRGDWRVLLLAGPGVSDLAAHSTAEGEAALEGALEELLRTCRTGSQGVVWGGGRWEYMVLPGGSSILLFWDGGMAVEAAVRAVRGAAAAALGWEVPEGSVRAAALPPCTLSSAREGLNAGALKVGRTGCVQSVQSSCRHAHGVG